MRTFAVAAVACLASCLLASGSRAELYQWTDEHGQVHVTDDGAKVPVGKAVSLDPSRPVAPEIQEKKPAAKRALAVGRVQPSAGPGRVHVLHFERAGREISLDATLEDRVTCNFKADTGASLNTMPRWAADELGIEITEDTPMISVVGVSGQPMRVPVVVLQSVRIGSVHVENLEMAILDTMNSGLLGMPFFNHFKVAIDPSKGELQLTELEADAGEGIYAGLGEDAWRERFAQLEKTLAAIQKARDDVPAYSETAAQNYFEHLDREERKVQRQLEELEDRALAAGVPAGWR